MGPTTFESIGRAILADADDLQAKLEKSCSDFLEKATEQMRQREEESNQYLRTLLAQLQPSDRPEPTSWEPSPTIKPSK